MQVNGTLTAIKAKTGVSQKGPWTAYSIGVTDDNGSLSWYQNGFTAPSVTEGSNVTFETAPGSKEGSVKVVGAITVNKTAQPQARGAVASALSGDARQNSIVRQNSTGHAVAIVASMLANGVVKLPAKGKAFDAYLELVNEVTNRIFLSNINAPSSEQLLAESAGKSAASGGPSSTPADEDYWGDE